MDRGFRLRTAHRCAARPTYPPCPHPGNERRQLPPETKPPQKESTRRPLTHERASGEKGLFRYAPEPFLPRNTTNLILLVAPFYSATVVSFYSALDTGVMVSQITVTSESTTILSPPA